MLATMQPVLIARSQTRPRDIERQQYTICSCADRLCGWVVRPLRSKPGGSRPAPQSVARCVPSASRGDSKQFNQVPSEDRFLFSVAQERGLQDEIHANGPVKWVIRSVEDLADADL